MVNDSQNVNQLIFDCVKNTVRKPRQECATHSRNDFRVKQWDLLEALELEFKSHLKFRAQPFTLRLIPIKRFANFANRPTGKPQAVRHEPLFRCALT